MTEQNNYADFQRAALNLDITVKTVSIPVREFQPYRRFILFYDQSTMLPIIDTQLSDTHLCLQVELFTTCHADFLADFLENASAMRDEQRGRVR